MAHFRKLIDNRHEKSLCERVAEYGILPIQRLHTHEKKREISTRREIYEWMSTETTMFFVYFIFFFIYVLHLNEKINRKRNVLSFFRVRRIKFLHLFGCMNCWYFMALFFPHNSSIALPWKEFIAIIITSLLVLINYIIQWLHLEYFMKNKSEHDVNSKWEFLESFKQRCRSFERFMLVQRSTVIGPVLMHSTLRNFKNTLFNLLRM